MILVQKTELQMLFAFLSFFEILQRASFPTTATKRFERNQNQLTPRNMKESSFLKISWAWGQTRDLCINSAFTNPALISMFCPTDGVTMIFFLPPNAATG